MRPMANVTPRGRSSGALDTLLSAAAERMPSDADSPCTADCDDWLERCLNHAPLNSTSNDSQVGVGLPLT